MATNSRIQAAGVGKNSKRHDLDGTPGLDSDLQQGEVSQLEAGQASVSNTQAQQGAVQGGAAQAAPAAAPVTAPNPLAFAAQKAGGQPALPMSGMQQMDTGEFLPLMEKLASGNSSSLLKQAYMTMYQNIQRRPFTGGATGLIDRQQLDSAVEEAF